MIKTHRKRHVEFLNRIRKGNILRVLVTGSTGFLGGRLIQYLSQNTSYQLLLGTRDLSKIPAQFTHLDAVAIDWTSKQQIELACSSVDCIIHLAGMNAGQCARAGADELAADVKATEMLINAAVSNNVKKFIYLSSAHVYNARLSGEINEFTEPANTHPYALNHLKKEKLVLSANISCKLKGIIVRLSNAFGAPVDPNSDCWMLLVNDLCRQLAISSKVVLKSTGLQRRDFITITDFCKAIELFITTPSGEGEYDIYNLGGGWSPTILEMATLIANRYELMFGRIIDVETVGSTEGEPIYPLLSYSLNRIRKLGFVPSGIGDAIREIELTINYCVDNFA